MPLGNPQNFMIATQGRIENPFIIFLSYLLVPTIINMFLLFFVIKIFYREHFRSGYLFHGREQIKDKQLASIARFSLSALLFLIFIKILSSFLGLGFTIELVHITIFVAAVALAFSNKRIFIIKKVDWHTLIYFASMFVLMQSVWDTGFFQSVLNDLHLDISSVPIIFAISVILSQFISNVPLVALFIPILSHANASLTELMALAAGSTIAGNLSILGAASNVIIIQNAEKRAKESLSFFEFSKIGVPLTLLNILVYWLYFAIL
ncbi:MAG: SLC13 family permease [Candidatus Diapherotrites archaeon]